jgi:hypothetical protein
VSPSALPELIREEKGIGGGVSVRRQLSFSFSCHGVDLPPCRSVSLSPEGRAPLPAGVLN